MVKIPAKKKTRRKTTKRKKRAKTYIIAWKGGKYGGKKDKPVPGLKDRKFKTKTEARKVMKTRLLGKYMKTREK